MRRTEVVAMHQSKVPVMQIVEQSGLSWHAVKAAIKRYEETGESALKPAARGRKPGTGRLLSERQETEVRKVIAKLRQGSRKNRPLLWNRVAVGKLIKQAYDIELSERALGNYLLRWGLVLKNSRSKPSDRCSAEVKTWLTANFATIERQARERSDEIYWLNKPMKLDSDMWAKAMPNTMATESGAEESTGGRLSMISVTNNRGKLWWAINEGRFTSDRQIKFANALLRCLGRKKRLILIRNDPSMFCSKEFKLWLMKHSDVISMIPDGTPEV